MEAIGNGKFPITIGTFFWGHPMLSTAYQAGSSYTYTIKWYCIIYSCLL
jgi:hypothetical protein